MARRKKATNRRTKPKRQSTVAGGAALGLALLIMMVIVGAVYWLNPKSTDANIDGNASVSHIGPILNFRETTGGR
jgi:hypothetical protein